MDLDSNRNPVADGIKSALVLCGKHILHFERSSRNVIWKCASNRKVTSYRRLPNTLYFQILQSQRLGWIRIADSNPNPNRGQIADSARLRTQGKRRDSQPGAPHPPSGESGQSGRHSFGNSIENPPHSQPGDPPTPSCEKSLCGFSLCGFSLPDFIMVSARFGCTYPWCVGL